MTWLIGLAGAVAAAVFIRRAWLRSHTHALGRALRITSELWDLAETAPAELLSAPIREALSIIFASYAEALGKSPYRTFAPNIARRSLAVLRLPRQQYRVAPGERPPGAWNPFNRLVELMGYAARAGHLPHKEYALAKSAAELSARSVEVTDLCDAACRAMHVRALSQAKQLKQRALAACRQLPEQTASQMRHMVETRMQGLS